ncbi:MAG: recombinase RecT [Metamycoplasmataceae bacterium]
MESKKIIGTAENGVSLGDAKELTSKYLLSIMKSMGIADKLTDNEKVQFIAMCQAMQLNPLKKEIYAVKYKDKFTIVVGYQTYIERAYATGLVDYYGADLIIPEGAEAKPMEWSCKFFIKRKDSTKEMTTTIYFKEFTTGQSTWLSKPKFMLEKCAIAVGMRRAFPLELGDMPYINEELWYHSKDNDDVVSQNINLEGIKK